MITEVMGAIVALCILTTAAAVIAGRRAYARASRHLATVVGQAHIIRQKDHTIAGLYRHVVFLRLALEAAHEDHFAKWAEDLDIDFPMGEDPW